VFPDRVHAGRALAARLLAPSGTSGTHTIVLAIPRGGVVVGAQVAEALGAPLDVTIPRKIPAPFNEELAIGAVTEDGTVLIGEEQSHHAGVAGADYVQAEAARQLREIQRRMRLYRGDRPLPAVAGQTVILVDDGIATGHTVRAALISIRSRAPRELVLAVPVAPPDTLAGLAGLADRVVCLLTPEPFFAVGQFYQDFRQVTDAEVLSLLTAHGRQ
jgi:putative phosphoribosyl transferase